MQFEKELQKDFSSLECETIDGEIYEPSLMRLKAGLESEGKTLHDAMKHSWEKPIVLRDGTRIYNRTLE